jgi:hypothetical protein
MNFDEEQGERCQRCGEVGEDRRTLWMACFYEMNELPIPFEQVQLRGDLHEKTGEEKVQYPSFVHTSPVFSETPTASHEWKFYQLRVCKDCRADWMSAIQQWFENVEPKDEPDTSIFVRDKGTNRQVTEEEFRRMQEKRNA